MQAGFVQAAYSSMCVTDLSSSWLPKTRISEADVRTYLAGLEQGAKLQRKAVTSATQHNRDTAVQEFRTWLASHVKCRNFSSCLPEDFIVYLTTHWAHEHAGYAIADTRIAAVVSVNALISHLAIELDKLGRVGP